MTLDTTKSGRGSNPWHRCSNTECNNMFIPYHGKVGCLCHVCDDKTPDRIKLNHNIKDLIKEM